MKKLQHNNPGTKIEAGTKKVAISIKIEIFLIAPSLLVFLNKWCFRFRKVYSFHCFFANGENLLQFVSTPFLNNDDGWTLTTIDPVYYDLPSRKVNFNEL